jgi:hypothetical protein
MTESSVVQEKDLNDHFDAAISAYGTARSTIEGALDPELAPAGAEMAKAFADSHRSVAWRTVYVCDETHNCHRKSVPKL